MSYKMFPVNFQCNNEYNGLYRKSSFPSKSYANNNGSINPEDYYYSPYPRSSGVGYKNCQNWCPHFERGSFSQGQSNQKYVDIAPTNYENVTDSGFDSKDYYKGVAIFRERNMGIPEIKDSFGSETSQELDYPPYHSESLRCTTYGDRSGRRNYPVSSFFPDWDENESPVFLYRKRRR